MTIHFICTGNIYQQPPRRGYRRRADKLFQQGRQAERKQLLRMLVGEVKLMPEDLEVTINYRLPEAVLNGLVAGDGFEPPTFGL